jgi:predicted ABC-type ATPase
MSSRIIAITGPAGSGKSTIGEKLAKILGNCVNIDADHIKHMIVSGFYKDDTNLGGWGLAGDSIGLLAKNFQEKGFDVVINGYIDEPAWTNIAKQVTITHKFLLLPSVEVAIDRDASRHSDVKMGQAVVTQHHQTFSSDDFYHDFRKLDTSAYTTEETVLSIIELISQD